MFRALELVTRTLVMVGLLIFLAVFLCHLGITKPRTTLARRLQQWWREVRGDGMHLTRRKEMYQEQIVLRARSGILPGALFMTAALYGWRERLVGIMITWTCPTAT